MEVKELTVKQMKEPFGFGKPTEVKTVAVEFPNGKVAHCDEDDSVFVYKKRDELKKALEVHGPTEIIEVN